MLSQGFNFAVLGLGNSNLLLDRQTTGPSDCNQVAQDLDSCLSNLGGTRYCPIGLADERIGLDNDVEPWMVELWSKLDNKAIT
jgi:sulfite reductase alpha subunit-like flavoprotein